MATVFVDPIRKSNGTAGWTVTVVSSKATLEYRELRFKGRKARQRAIAAALELEGRLVVAP